ncbi:MAG: hypothetical protein NTX22_00620 [Ignavibacteriales bacterium]|nr:hypothetical protein [Ignavibacteriales bacterium]
MKKIFIQTTLIALAILFSWNCSNDNNPLIPNEKDFYGNLEIKTEKSEFYIGDDFSNSFALVLATVINSSSDTFYTNLGDGYAAGIDHDKLLIAEGTDGYFEKNIGDNNWKQLNRGILFEGSKIIRILPSRKYNLHATAYLDSNSIGKFRLRINYYKTVSQTSVDTLSDTSNTFIIYKR